MTSVQFTLLNTRCFINGTFLFFFYISVECRGLWVRQNFYPVRTPLVFQIRTRPVPGGYEYGYGSLYPYPFGQLMECVINCFFQLLIITKQRRPCLGRNTSFHSFAKKWRKISVHLTKRKSQITASRTGIPAGTRTWPVPVKYVPGIPACL